MFQGDSITDCGRDRGYIYSYGCGYPNIVSSTLSYDYPGEYEFINRGINGNRIVDLYARIRNDIINLKPDYLSILIGVNDVWHGITHNNGVDEEKFEKIYSMLVQEVLSELPSVKIMILEPYVLNGSATCNTDECTDKWERFNKGVGLRAAAAKRVAEKFKLPFVPLQNKFNEAASLTDSPIYWAGDGVHPTCAGHELISRSWLETFMKIK